MRLTYLCLELFDQKWKNQYGGAEPFWGLFDENRNLKDLTIPSCIADEEAPVGDMGSNTGSGSSNDGDDSGNGDGNGNSNGSSSDDNDSGAPSTHSSNVFTFVAASLLLTFLGGVTLL